MKNNKIIKNIIVLFIMCFFIFIVNFQSYVQAMTVDTLFADDTLKDINQGVQSNEGIVGGIKKVIGIIQVIGTGVSIIMVTVLGIKYILASVEEKAEIKKMAMPILVGAFLLFSATNIIVIVEEFATGVINS